MNSSWTLPREFPRPWTRGMLVLAASLLLAACGGGSSSGGGSGNGSGSGQDTGVRQLQIDGAGASSGVAGAPLGSLPGVRVVDGQGSPVAGVAVSFEVVQGGGQVTPASVLSGADGRARPQGWVLGTVAGPNALRASISGAAPLSFAVTGTAGPAAQFQRTSPASQEGTTGQPVATAPGVRVTDAHGNPVAGVGVNFAVITGGGSVAPSSAVSGPDGVAAVASWTLGPTEGLQQLRATASGLGELLFSASAVSAGNPLELSIVSVQLNQGSQTVAGDIPVVAGRPGLLRVVVSANRDNTAAPPVRVRLSRPGVAPLEYLLPAPGVGVPQWPDLARRDDTWNLELGADEVRPGLAIEVLVDPDETLPLASREGTQFPAGGGQFVLPMESPGLFRVRFVRIEATRHSRSGNITAGNMEEFLTSTRRWLPVGGLHAELRGEPFATDRDLGTESGISGLLSDLRAARTVEVGTSDWYYHGIFPRVQGTSIAGIGYLPGSPGNHSARAALSFDVLPQAAGTVAHELGHNLGREHSPCGSVGSSDPAYPHPNADIGSPGFDILNGNLLVPGTPRDYMSYCNPRWTSDYTYREILDWRSRDPYAVPADVALMSAAPETAGMISAGGRSPGLLLWGRVWGDGLELNPAFSLDGHAVLPEEEGPYRLRGLGGDGRVLFELGFAGTAVPHATDPDERHFAWFVPLAPASIAALARIELFGPAGHVEQSVPRARALAEPEVARMAADGAEGALRLHWDAEVHPLVMVRDPASGEVLALGRSGDLRLPASATREAEVLVSDGVRSAASLPLSPR